MLRSLALTVVFLSAPAALAATVEVDADDATDFSTYRTFTVEVGTPPVSQRVSDELTAIVTREVTARGLQVAPSAPDVIVRTHVLVDAHSLEELADESQWEFWTGVRNISAAQLGEGTLLIDFVDPDSGRIVWRGLTTERLNRSDAANERRLPKIVRRLLRRFPGR